MKHVVLFRHGPTQDTFEWMQKGKDDSQRSLTDEGIQVTQKATEGLKKVLNQHNTDLVTNCRIVSSPYIRAIQTADILKNTLQISKDIKILDDLMPNCHPKALASNMFSYTEAILIAVGHQPHLSLLSSYLLTQEEKNVLIPIERGGAVGLLLTRKEDPGQLLYLMTPDHLAQIGC